MKPTPQESLDALAESARAVPRDEAIVELGVHLGATAIAMAKASEAPVFAIDLWDMRLPTGTLDTFRVGRGFTASEVFRQFLENLVEAGVQRRVTWVKSDTAEAAKLWSRPIGLLHIDAAHDAPSVLRDYRAWSPFVVPGGTLAMDDAQPNKRGHAMGVGRAISSDIMPSGLWEPREELVAGRLWIARRRESVEAAA